MTAMRAFSATEVDLTGVSLVEASAGTGKTYAITTLLLRLLLERRLSLEQILVVTFTEAATAELRDRIRTRLREAIEAFDELGGDRRRADEQLGFLARHSAAPAQDRQRLSRALGSADEAAIFTIHGFCHRMLNDHAFDTGLRFDAELVTDLQPLCDEVLEDFFARELSAAPAEQVRVIGAAGLDPQSCRDLADRASRYPHLRLLPPVPAELPELGTGPYRQAFERVRQSFDEGRVCAALQSAALKQNMYPQGKMADWCRGISRFLQAPQGVPALPDKLDKLTQASLRQGTKKGHRPPADPFFAACDELLERQRALAEAGQIHAARFKRKLLESFARAFEKRKQRQGVLSFDDLLLGLHRTLDAGSPAGPSPVGASLRRRFPAALIDEFQDTDPVQYQIFEAIYGRLAGSGEQPASSLFLIGDPKQAIYSFRGADVFAYLHAAGQTPPGRRYTMQVNWRSDPGLVRALGALFSRAARPFLLDIDYPPQQARPGAADQLRDRAGQAVPPFSILFVRPPAGQRRLDKSWAGRHLPDLVAGEIVRLLQSGLTLDGRPVEPSDVAVLTRSNRQAVALQAALRKLQVPTVMLSDQSVFDPEVPEGRELQIVLLAVAEPTSNAALRAALTTELCGVTANELGKLEADEEGWQRWVDRFHRYHRLWARSGFVQMVRAFMAEVGVPGRLLRLPDGERRMTNLLHLVELLHGAAVSQHLGPAGLLGWLEVQRSHAGDRVRPETAQIRLESDAVATKITTIHRSKGLEYPIVYCPYLHDGTLLRGTEQVLELHDPDADHALTLELLPKSEEAARSRQLCEREALAESLRLLYVALTRARHRCTVVWGAFPQLSTSPLGYLLHPPALSGEATVAEVRAALRGLDSERLLAEIRALAQAHPGAIELSEIPSEPGSPPRPFEPPAQPGSRRASLACRAVARPIASFWRMASFSQLTSARAELVDPREGRDRDEGGAAGDVAVAAKKLDATMAAEPDGPLCRLADFPRGAQAGNFFHELLEQCDFTTPQPAVLRPLIEKQLLAYGFSVQLYGAMVADALSGVLRTPLESGGELRLSDIPKARRLNELEFYFPVAAAPSADQVAVSQGTQLELLFDGAGAGRPGCVPVGALDRAKLAAVFADHPSLELCADYAEAVGRLRFLPLRGWLKGYIDLVMVHRDRFYVVDYKTNYLGATLPAYEQARLLPAMARGHYYLQYHLYAVAVHRYLGRRLAGYDYDRHFGGVYYLFLRGMTPESGSGTGVFFEKPPRGRIEALSALLERPPRSPGREK